MKNIFTEHPKSVGETYFEHFKMAFSFGFNMLVGGIACMIHAFLPNLFEKTGSNILLNVTHRFIRRMPQIDTRVRALSETIEGKSSQKI